MVKILQAIESMNEKIMDFLYAHTKPEERIEDMKDEKLRGICSEIVKWYGEMGEYWCDDAQRITKNLEWGNNLIKKIEALTA